MSPPARPVISQIEAAALIRNTPQDSPFTADGHLGELLDRLLENPPAPATLFDILEELRPVLHGTQEELTREYRNKPLPQEVDDRATFLTVIRRWQQVARAYEIAALHLHPAADDIAASKLQATMQQRALHYVGRELFEHYVARQEIPPGLWLRLHGCFATAEKRGHDHTPVSDGDESPLHQTHCAASYIASLLIEMAGPYGQTLRNLLLIRQWATDWASLVTIQPLQDEFELPPYVVRLDEDKPLHLFDDQDELAPAMRALDCARLGLQINHLLSQLQGHTTPAQLGLGEAPAYLARPLLARLLRPWTLAASPRKFRRFASDASAQATGGFAAMHYAISGQPFVGGDPSLGYSHADADRMYTFGERTDNAIANPASAAGPYPVDTWQVLNHSANGFRLLREGGGERLVLGQALAVKPHDGEHFLLCRINWLMEEHRGSLLVGVSVMGGLPEGIGLRSGGTRDRYARAFLLPGSPITQEGETLILPPGLYIPKGSLELLRGEQPQRIRMLQVIERGSDFDRITFEVV